MLNIKQAKPGVSGPKATRAALQGSQESPRVYTVGGGGEKRKEGGCCLQNRPHSPQPVGPRDGPGT